MIPLALLTALTKKKPADRALVFSSISSVCEVTA